VVEGRVDPLVALPPPPPSPTPPPPPRRHFASVGVVRTARQWTGWVFGVLESVDRNGTPAHSSVPLPSAFLLRILRIYSLNKGWIYGDGIQIIRYPYSLKHKYGQ
jgi:hypothetical protein